jgi:hypothetical protein
MWFLTDVNIKCLMPKDKGKYQYPAERSLNLQQALKRKEFPGRTK